MTPRRANRIDTNQPEIVEELREMGYKVLNISSLKNCCDLIVSDGLRNEYIEIKNPETCRGITEMAQEERERFLTEGEAIFADSFRVWIVISADEVHEIFVRLWTN